MSQLKSNEAIIRRQTWYTHPDYPLEVFIPKKAFEEALAQKDAEVTIGRLTLKLMEGDYYWVTNEDGEGQGISKERLYHEMNDMFNRLF